MSYTIIWDFDGTLLPNTPYDSEQRLLLALCRPGPHRLRLFKRQAAKLAAYADRKEWLGRFFKPVYNRLVAGTTPGMIDAVAEELAAGIGVEDREAILSLKRNGNSMWIVSCGTYDLIARVCTRTGTAHCFDRIVANRFLWSAGRIAGMDVQLSDGAEKLAVVQKSGVAREETIAVGDGYTDMPLLDWAGVPVLIDRNGTKKARLRSKKIRVIRRLAQTADIVAGLT